MLEPQPQPGGVTLGPAKRNPLISLMMSPFDGVGIGVAPLSCVTH